MHLKDLWISRGYVSTQLLDFRSGPAPLSPNTRDDSASEAEKALAGVVIDFDHKAGSEAKKTLESLIIGVSLITGDVEYVH